jgi:hypothetical protein
MHFACLPEEFSQSFLVIKLQAKPLVLNLNFSAKPAVAASICPLMRRLSTLNTSCSGAAVRIENVIPEIAGQFALGFPLCLRKTKEGLRSRCRPAMTVLRNRSAREALDSRGNSHRVRLGCPL